MSPHFKDVCVLNLGTFVDDNEMFFLKGRFLSTVRHHQSLENIIAAFKVHCVTMTIKDDSNEAFAYLTKTWEGNARQSF